jgi:hypothetical protein
MNDEKNASDLGYAIVFLPAFRFRVVRGEIETANQALMRLLDETSALGPMPGIIIRRLLVTPIINGEFQPDRVATFAASAVKNKRILLELSKKRGVLVLEFRLNNAIQSI